MVHATLGHTTSHVTRPFTPQVPLCKLATLHQAIVQACALLARIYLVTKRNAKRLPFSYENSWNSVNFFIWPFHSLRKR
jgi:hypothetical protein